MGKNCRVEIFGDFNCRVVLEGNYDMETVLPKAYVFGAGAVCLYYLPLIQKQYHVIAVLDNDKTKQGENILGIPICAPESILENDFEVVIIASRAGVNTIKEQLVELGVESKKINTEYVDYAVKSRIVFLNNLGQMFNERGITGSVAECGVFMGEFAREINRVFPSSKLYLFDTFAGFDERDLSVERSLNEAGDGNQYANFTAGHFNIAREDVVIKNLPHPQNAVICKGYFPETTNSIGAESFCFVNLDFDLYNPTLAGLEYFYPRMVKGGVILIHDYFAEACKGVKTAVKEFENKVGTLHVFPIGDSLSVGINC